MSRLDTEFIGENIDFISVNEYELEERILKRIEEQHYEDLDTDEFVQLSSMRQAIFEWYPFQQDCEILELGGGMGAITQILTKKAKLVTTVEYKERRASIIKKRLQDEKNLTVICENPSYFQSEKKYDYVIVHELFGYVKKYLRCEDAYNVFFNNLKKLIKPSGKILILADNRLALKYFAGSIEEYSKKMFVGLSGYKNYSYIETFTKQDLIDFSVNMNMKNTKCYYVNSDYYFANEIYTDSSLNFLHYKGETRSTTWAKYKFFDENSVYSALQKNKIVEFFVDAFLFQMENGENKESEEKSEVVYYRANLQADNKRYGQVLLKEKNEYYYGIYHIQEGYIQKIKKVKIEEFIEIMKEELLESPTSINKRLQNEYSFPYIDASDVITIGVNQENEKDNITSDYEQRLKERELINRVIGELYETK